MTALRIRLHTVDCNLRIALSGRRGLHPQEGGRAGREDRQRSHGLERSRLEAWSERRDGSPRARVRWRHCDPGRSGGGRKERSRSTERRASRLRRRPPWVTEGPWVRGEPDVDPRTQTAGTRNAEAPYARHGSDPRPRRDARGRVRRRRRNRTVRLRRRRCLDRRAVVREGAALDHEGPFWVGRRARRRHLHPHELPPDRGEDHHVRRDHPVGQGAGQEQTVRQRHVGGSALWTTT